MAEACWRFTLLAPYSIANARTRQTRGFSCKAQAPQIHANGNHVDRVNKKQKIVVVGSGWAGLGAAHHLCNQGFDVTVLEDGNDFGGNDAIGVQGFWYPYRNIFSLVDELGIKPFTSWIKSAQYSTEGLEVEFPVFQDLPELPTPLGILSYTQFKRLQLVDRISSLPLMAAVIDFDNTDTAWRKYDSFTARELCKQFGLSERLYRDVLGPMLQVSLYAPAEQCSAAATLGMLYYISLAHQKDFNMVLCRGAIREKIFDQWMELLETKGCQIFNNTEVLDFSFDEETGCISEVICRNRKYNADAVILAVGISKTQDLVKNSAALCTREEFLKVLNLSGVDVLTVKLWLDKKVSMPNASNACSAFEDSFGWTFFDLNGIHDEHKDSPVTILEADFYYANELLPLKDEDIAKKVMSYLSKCIKGLETVSVMEKEIARFPKSLTHFFPGSYRHMMRGSTSFPNLFMAGDWIITRHGSWSQEKSYVTGLEAANRVVDFLGEGSFAKIIPVEEDEPHIQTLRNLNRSINQIRAQLPLSDFFLQ